MTELEKRLLSALSYSRTTRKRAGRVGSALGNGGKMSGLVTAGERGAERARSALISGGTLERAARRLSGSAAS